MNGFNDDVVSILKHSTLLNKASIGLVMGNGNLVDYLDWKGLHAVGRTTGIGGFDYIVVAEGLISAKRLLRSLTLLRNGGIIILQLGNRVEEFEPIYKNISNRFFATKVQYDNRYYLVIHPGEDYGN